VGDGTDRQTDSEAMATGGGATAWVNGRDTPKILAKVTPTSRILLEDLTGHQPVKKLSSFHGSRRYIIVFVKAHHLSES
jgi:hypothetical protein